ncbi:CAP domain-containing protein [Paenibacillus sinopodophylli]|uniref:CAP domain-containing protein n=1 Tax=Paenibacillus sinopodophylli TaxID=1837342 RepID=UPI00110CA0AA|nr:CAP domain-containing protein [Paenibacillus sinopodophylli]
MKKFVALAALLVVTGCSSGSNMMHKQSTHEYANDKTPLITTAPYGTRASSVATTTPGKPDGTLRSSQFTFPDWLFGDRTGIQNPTVQYPGYNQPTTQNPSTNNPSAQNPSTPNPTTQNPSGQKATTGQFEQQVLQIVNAERSKAGLGGLSMDDKLANMAMVKAKDMSDNNYFDHNSPTYGSPFDMMKQFQITYRSAGENIAKGQPTAERVMNDWMNSPGHRANILNGSFSKIGVAYYNGSWVQEFIG